MSFSLFFLFLLILAYLLGSIPSAIIICRIMRLPDPRTQGSQNPGTTNVLRIGGKQAAIATLIGDMLKGAIPVVIAYFVGLGMSLAAWVLLFAFLGHLFPVFARFKGGKGVATLLGGLLGLSWIIGLAVLLTWALIALITRYSSLAAIIAAIMTPIYMIWFAPSFTWLPLVIVTVMLLWRHKQNIARLVSGTERKIGKKSHVVDEAALGKQLSRHGFSAKLKRLTKRLFSK